MKQPQELGFLAPGLPTGGARAVTRDDYHADEAELVGRLLPQVELSPDAAAAVNARTVTLVKAVRGRQQQRGALEEFMREYDLSSEEGVVLLCLAEALLRIPDAETAEKLIADKLKLADWEAHLGKSQSLFVNASTWGLMLTGKLVQLGASTRKDFASALGRLVNRSGEPVVRTAIRQAMRIMGFQYVMGRTIEEALERSTKKQNAAYRYSFDMLGEAALTAGHAQAYLAAYRDAIAAIGAQRGASDIFAAPSISVKLSALHPRYHYEQRERVVAELAPRLLELALAARRQNIALTVDAEEADRLVLSLDVFARVLADPALAGWDGLGLAVQTYQKRAVRVLEHLATLARSHGHRIPVRLVKGAYWDSEIKHAQVNGHAGYPVFTRKANTDVAYLACARLALSHRDEFYPQFATHNANTIAMVTQLAGERTDYEFQRLHGMGEDLYGVVLASPGFNHACRVYAPVGSHEDLLPYLVRRLLENGANTSFVNRIVDERLPVEQVAEDPVAKVAHTRPVAHPALPLPVDIHAPRRRNSRGLNLANETELQWLAEQMQPFSERLFEAEPLLASGPGSAGGKARKRGDASQQVDSELILNEPANQGRPGVRVRNATEAEVGAAIADAVAFASEWERTPVAERAACLERAADQMEARMPEFMAVCVREAGKTLHDAVAEVREAVDFLRYYAMQGRRLFGQPEDLPGPTGEANSLSLHGRGVFACISPWNFPLAIFTGQVSAALVAGNPVLAKPAEQTPATAALATELLHAAGIPRAALQLLPGEGAVVGARLSSDPAIAGVAFTGSTETARLINRALAARDAPLASLVAETGGLNAMLVDSSALPEQVAKDAIASAFLSAGQRCSALRVLFLQRDIADRVIELLVGAMQELVVGDPRWLSTDVGPVIDAEALAMLRTHDQRMQQEGRLLGRTPLAPGLNGHFFPPTAFEIDSIAQLGREVFGPILHVVRYRARDLDQVIDSINATGYGLTLGVHSRIEDTQRHIAQKVRVGNCYVNRSMTGAVVGVQPFGGEGLSGTGPKAGGPHYLLRFATERTLTVNTAAVGGNASLLAMED